MKTEKISEEEVAKLGELTGHFRLNLPDSFENYQSGNGEGLWAVSKDPQVYKDVKADRESGQFEAYAANDSGYYPHLVCGSKILGEFRGKNRCVAIWDSLTGSEDAKKNKEEMFKKIK